MCRSAFSIKIAIVGTIVLIAACTPRVQDADTDDSRSVSAESASISERVADSGPAAASGTRSAAVLLAEKPLPDLLSADERFASERMRYAATLQSSYRAERVDASWAPQAERALAAVADAPALAQTGIRAQALVSECRTHTCRISAEFASYHDAQGWADFFLTGTGAVLGRAELFVQRAPNGGASVLIFGARP